MAGPVTRPGRAGRAILRFMRRQTCLALCFLLVEGAVSGAGQAQTPAASQPGGSLAPLPPAPSSAGGGWTQPAPPASSSQAALPPLPPPAAEPRAVPPPAPAPPVPPAPSPPGAYYWPYAVGFYDRSPPTELRYVEGRPIPAGYHLETRARKGLVITGAILLGVPYALSASVASSSTADSDRWLWLPVIGPFADLAARGDRCVQSYDLVRCTDDSAERFFLTLDGIVQAAGTAMLVLGLALPQRLLVRDDAPFAASSPPRFSWSVAPRSFGRAGAGILLGAVY